MAPTDLRAERTSPKAVVGTPRAQRRAVMQAIGIALVGLLLAAAIGADLWASAQYRASGDSHKPLAARLAAAEAAAAVWPFARDYRTRAITLRGLELFEGGDILGAYDVLHAEYVREAIADSYGPELVAAHQLVGQSYRDWSSRAAHVMHGKEQPDGTIKPDDVQHFPKPVPAK